eukprot:5877354-Amphidinium_carterae.1
MTSATSIVRARSDLKRTGGPLDDSHRDSRTGNFPLNSCWLHPYPASLTCVASLSSNSWTIQARDSSSYSLVQSDTCPDQSSSSTSVVASVVVPPGVQAQQRTNSEHDGLQEGDLHRKPGRDFQVFGSGHDFGLTG